MKEKAKEPGFPRFKSRKRAKVVFHLEPDTVRVEGKRVRLPKIGWVRMTKPLRFEGEIVATVAISERAGKWYVSLNVKTEHVPIESQGGAVGIDLGIKTMAVLSDGKVFDNPRFTYRLEKLLARAQRQMARKQRGSNRWRKAKLRAQRIHKRIADARSNAIHQATGYIAREYSFVGIENLNVAGMVKNHCLAKAVSDVGMSEFRRQLQYKVGWEQGTVVEVSRWFPSSKLCNVCGCLNNELTLADRTWACDCGTVHDRDQNASRNIRDEALRTANGSEAAARGGSGAVMPTCETRTGRTTRPVK